MVSGSVPRNRRYRPFDGVTKRAKETESYVHRLSVHVVAGPDRPRAELRREGGPAQEIRQIARRTLAQGQVGAPPLRPGGRRRERGDLAPGLEEVGGQRAPLEPSAFSRRRSARTKKLKADG